MVTSFDEMPYDWSNLNGVEDRANAVHVLIIDEADQCFQDQIVLQKNNNLNTQTY